jgi:hypothetical protein
MLHLINLSNKTWINNENKFLIKPTFSAERLGFIGWLIASSAAQIEWIFDRFPRCHSATINSTNVNAFEYQTKLCIYKIIMLSRAAVGCLVASRRVTVSHENDTMRKTATKCFYFTICCVHSRVASC